MKAIVKSNPKQMLREGRQLVRFQFHHPDAKAVFVAGSFNNWHPGASEMVRLEGDLWAKDLVLEPGKYEYLFVVDGVWKTDPKAAENAPNPFGGANSILY